MRVLASDRSIRVFHRWVPELSFCKDISLIFSRGPLLLSNSVRHVNAKVYILYLYQYWIKKSFHLSINNEYCHNEKN